MAGEAQEAVQVINQMTRLTATQTQIVTTTMEAILALMNKYRDEKKEKGYDTTSEDKLAEHVEEGGELEVSEIRKTDREAFEDKANTMGIPYAIFPMAGKDGIESYITRDMDHEDVINIQKSLNSMANTRNILITDEQEREMFHDQRVVELRGLSYAECEHLERRLKGDNIVVREFNESGNSYGIRIRENDLEKTLEDYKLSMIELSSPAGRVITTDYENRRNLHNVITKASRGLITQDIALYDSKHPDHFAIISPDGYTLYHKDENGKDIAEESCSAGLDKSDYADKINLITIGMESPAVNSEKNFRQMSEAELSRVDHLHEGVREAVGELKRYDKIFSGIEVTLEKNEHGQYEVKFEDHNTEDLKNVKYGSRFGADMSPEDITAEAAVKRSELRSENIHARIFYEPSVDRTPELTHDDHDHDHEQANEELADYVSALEDEVMSLTADDNPTIDMDFTSDVE